ncbi:hypothetical protein AAMO2058_000669100 [Amorphochlora amoebiformis]
MPREGSMEKSKLAKNKFASIPSRAAAKFVDLVAKTTMALSVGGIFTVKGLILTTVYEVVVPVIWKGQTIGKKVMSIKFRRTDGKPVNLSTTIIRNIGESLFYVLGSFAVATSNRSLADRMAGTEVVDESAPPVSQDEDNPRDNARERLLRPTVSIRSAL